MFGRRGNKNDRQRAVETTVDNPLDPGPAGEPGKDADRHRATGPWDASEDVSETPRVDLGCMRVPVGEKTQIRFDMVRDDRIIGVTLINDTSAVQVQAFAAPKTSGLWDDMRAELIEQITRQGGRSEEFDGTFGPEVRAVVPVEGKKSEDGRQLGQRMRFLGVDGPRWVLRGVIRGEGAVKPQVMAQVEEVFQHIVIVRGDDPVPPREMLKITVPKEIQEQVAAQRDQQRAARRAEAQGADPEPPQQRPASPSAD